MKTTLAVVGAILAATGIWFAYFWLEERRQWAEPIGLTRGTRVEWDRFRRVL